MQKALLIDKSGCDRKTARSGRGERRVLQIFRNACQISTTEFRETDPL